MGVKRIRRRLSQLAHKMYAIAYGATHKIENKILFSSFGGAQYSDSPRAISEKMHELYPEHEIVWTLTDTRDLSGFLPDYVRICRGDEKHGLRLVEELVTSFCFVTNNENDISVYKKGGQYFVQTYHGDRGFKKVLYDTGLKHKITDSRVTDICIAGSDYGEKTYRTAFRYGGKVLKHGMPRNDILINSNADNESAIKTRLGIPANHRVLLYAPTYRDHQKDKQPINVELSTVLDLLSKDGHDWCCIVRAHKSSAGFILKDMAEGRLIDATSYPDMADLLQVADFLITDYSSCAGDFILKRKPVILAAFDAGDYERNCRALNVDLNKTGYYIAANQEQLNDCLKRLTIDDYVRSCEEALSYYGTQETGNSSSAVCEMIHQHYTGSISAKQPGS